MRPTFPALPKPPNLASPHPTAYHRVELEERRSRFMRVSGLCNRPLLVVLCFFLSTPLLSAQAQDQRPADKRKGFVYETYRSFQKWLDEDVRWIVTDEERADFKKLTTDDQRDKFVEDFWNRRNPTPQSSENPYKEEHYRRIAYTNTHFGAAVPGWKTDRGRFYIMYGPPDSMDSKPRLAAPTETWHYLSIEGIGRNVVLTFTDKCACGKFELSGADSDSRVPKIPDLLQP
jgi:GWxTD domain-containing protein